MSANGMLESVLGKSLVTTSKIIVNIFTNCKHITKNEYLGAWSWNHFYVTMLFLPNMAKLQSKFINYEWAQRTRETQLNTRRESVNHGPSTMKACSAVKMEGSYLWINTTTFVYHLVLVNYRTQLSANDTYISTFSFHWYGPRKLRHMLDVRA